MKNLTLLFGCVIAFITLTSQSACETPNTNTSALTEQAHTETNQQRLNSTQPLPDITWSMERDNLIKLKKLQNDRTINFYMYIFVEGVSQPVGYYQVNKVSSVNSQLSNPEQIIHDYYGGYVVSSPSEDGSYGTNGDAVFGFTPEDICIQTNMHYICASVPLHFQNPVTRLAIIDTDEAKKMLEASKKAMQ